MKRLSLRLCPATWTRNPSASFLFWLSLRSAVTLRKIFVRKVPWNWACLFWYRLSSSTITSPKFFWFKLSASTVSWVFSSIISSSFLSSASRLICSSGPSKSLCLLRIFHTEFHHGIQINSLRWNHFKVINNQIIISILVWCFIFVRVLFLYMAVTIRFTNKSSSAMPACPIFLVFYDKLFLDIYLCVVQY